MNFTHLEYAIAVAKTGSIRKASQKLLVSQPYLSSMIKNLEAELGYKLFERSAAGIMLTPEGRLFMKSAEKIIGELDKIRKISSKEDDSLTIASYYAADIMNCYMEFRRTHSAVASDRFKEMGCQEVIDSVESGSSKLGFIFFGEEKIEKYSRLIEEAGLKGKDLFAPIELMVVMSKHHPLAKKESISHEELRTTPYVLYDDQSSVLYLDVLGIADNPNLLMVSDRGGYFDALRSGNYIALIGFFGNNRLRDDDLIIKPMEGRQKRILSKYIFTPDHVLSTKEKDFLSYLKKASVK